MRKFVCILLIVIIAMLPMFSISATEEDSNETSIDSELGEILVKAFDSKEREALQNKESYLDDVKHLEILDQPIVKVYSFPSKLVPSGFLPFEQLISTCDEMIKNDEVNGCGYIVFDDEPIEIYHRYVGGIYNRDVIQLTRPIALYMPSQDLVYNYVSDIQEMKANVEILEEHCKISNIVVFNGYNNFDGALIYADTDKGIFVKHYSDPTDEGIWFREDDFLTLVKAYADQKDWTKPDYTHGDSSELSAFIESYADRIDELPPLSSEAPKKVPMYVWIISISGAIVLCASVVIFIFRKKIFISKYRR